MATEIANGIWLITAISGVIVIETDGLAGETVLDEFQYGTVASFRDACNLEAVASVVFIGTSQAPRPQDQDHGK